jgi:hypothetical protein
MNVYKKLLRTHDEDGNDILASEFAPHKFQVKYSKDQKIITGYLGTPIFAYKNSFKVGNYWRTHEAWECNALGKVLSTNKVLRLDYLDPMADHEFLAVWEDWLDGILPDKLFIPAPIGTVIVIGGLSLIRKLPNVYLSASQIQQHVDRIHT